MTRRIIYLLHVKGAQVNTLWLLMAFHEHALQRPRGFGLVLKAAMDDSPPYTPSSAVTTTYSPSTCSSAELLPSHLDKSQDVRRELENSDLQRLLASSAEYIGSRRTISNARSLHIA